MQLLKSSGKLEDQISYLERKIMENKEQRVVEVKIDDLHPDAHLTHEVQTIES